mgnify:CR=1 FL=1|tara:strand:+ start:232 stop:1425 length:1194 start_codon:yes stop_codon:yes gene_type:complete
MARFASGKKSKAISDISGFEVKYTQLKTTWDNLRVEPEEYSPKHPQLTPAKNVVDATALFNPRPDNDPENVTILFGFTNDIFASRIERSQKGTNIHAFGRIGQVGISLDEPVTGLVGTTAIGTFAPGFAITGVSATGSVNNVTPEDQTDVSLTGVAGTGTINDAFAGFQITGTGSTFAIGTETINHDRIFELDNGGVVGTGGTGDESFDTQTGVITGISATGTIGTIDNNADIGVTGVSGTSGIGTFGEEGDGTLNLTVTPTSATGTANAGVEVAESEIPESNENGWGENAFGTGVWGGDPEVKGIGGVGSSTIDIFQGPNPQSGVSATSTLNNIVVQGNLNVTGLTGTGAIGTSTFFIETAIPVTGVAGTTTVGTEEAKVNPGWGEGTWSSGTWGN